RPRLPAASISARCFSAASCTVPSTAFARSTGAWIASRSCVACGSGGSLAGTGSGREQAAVPSTNSVAQVAAIEGLAFVIVMAVSRWRRSRGPALCYAHPIPELAMDPHRWRLDGQLALVTGGSAGIGLAIARELLGFGARVLLTARNGDLLERARDELAEEFPDSDVRALIADVADDEQRRELLDWVEDQGEGLNILVNNAGGNLSRATTDYTEDEWREIFEVNLFSAFELARYAYPLLTKHAAS